MSPQQVVTGLTDEYFEGTAKLRRTFPSALCEIIDNSIAATPAGANGFFIDVYVGEQRKTSQLDFGIADGGAGMPKKFVADGLFLLGPFAHAGTPGPFAHLNQFGLGLKYALPWLTAETNLEFDLRTSCEPSPGSRLQITCIHDRLATRGMQIDACPKAGTLAHFNEGVHARGPNPKVGTRLRFATKTDKAYAGWEELGVDKASMNFDRFVDSLVEHLGLTYRDFLPQKVVGKQALVNSIKVRTSTRQIEVAPVPVPLTAQRMERSFGIKAGGIDAAIKYRRGLLDEGVHRILYHKPVVNAQGYDVQVAGKVIESAAFERVWGIIKHPSYNRLAGELIIEINSGDIPLVATKDGLDWSSDFAFALTRKIKSLDSNASNLLTTLKLIGQKPPPPPKAKKPKWQGDEHALRNLLKQSLDRLGTGRAVPEHTAWDKSLTGIEPQVAVDLSYEEPGKFVIVEAKYPTASVQDVYQLRMYWDGFCDSSTRSKRPTGPHPTSAVLLAKAFKPGTRWLSNYLSVLRCACGKKYQISCCGWGSLGLPPKSPTGAADDSKVASTLKRWLA